MRYLRLALFALLSVCLTGCDLPDESLAEKNFKLDYPNYQFIKCIAGEGDSDAVYFHFDYRDETGKLKKMQILYFRNLGDKAWSHKRIDGQNPSNFPIVLPGPSKPNG
jgi:hypothetical protein